MVRQINSDQIKHTTALDSLLKRGLFFDTSIDDTVRRIVLAVAKNGDQSIKDFTLEYDGVQLEALKVSLDEQEKAWQQTDQRLKQALKKSARRIQTFHEKQLEKSWCFEGEYGERLGQIVKPIERVGVYVPGGSAVYPSTLLMNVIPAQVAGVKDIVVISPPQKNGEVATAILAAAKLLGITEIYKVGGAQGVAALAYGTQTIKPVDKIVGPGNIYVARAKQLVYGKVGIDMVAGPSEICIIADDSANPSWIAADMLSQAEHDKDAKAFLITPSESLIKRVQIALDTQLQQLERSDIASKSLKDNGILFKVKDLEEAVHLSNQIAPEHLEVMVEDEEVVANNIKHAGAIFVGDYSPEAIGDYIAGPNHTLPTGGTARFSSPLGVYDFLTKSSYIKFNQNSFEQVADEAQVIANFESLFAHEQAIKIRRNK